MGCLGTHISWGNGGAALTGDPAAATVLLVALHMSDSAGPRGKFDASQSPLAGGGSARSVMCALPRSPKVSMRGDDTLALEKRRDFAAAGYEPSVGKNIFSDLAGEGG